MMETAQALSHKSYKVVVATDVTVANGYFSLTVLSAQSCKKVLFCFKILHRTRIVLVVLVIHVVDWARIRFCLW